MTNNVIITTTARKKLVLARAGESALPKIVGMAFGSGGVDEIGDVIPPLENQTELTSELLRKEIDKYEVLEGETATVRYTCTLATGDLADKNISEIGLYDEDNDLVCIKTFKAKGKDSDLEMTFQLDDVF